MESENVVIGDGRGTEIFDLQITVSSRGRAPVVALSSGGGARSYDLRYSIFGLSIATDAFVDAAVPKFDAIRDAVRIRSSARELALFLGSHAPIKMEIAPAGQPAAASVAVAAFSLTSLAQQLARASEGFAEASDDATESLAYASAMAVAQPFSVSVNFTLRKLDDVVLPSTTTTTSAASAAASAVAIAEAAAPAAGAAPTLAASAAAAAPAPTLRQYHVSIDLRKIRCTSTWPSASSSAYVKYRFAPFVAKTVRTRPGFAARALSEAEILSGYTKFVLQIAPETLAEQLERAPLTLGVFAGETQLGTCVLPLRDVLRTESVWCCPFTKREFAERSRCVAHMSSVDSVDSSRVAPVERREMKRLLAVAVAVDEDGGAGEPRAPIAELEVVATIEDFGPLAAGAAPGASSALMASIYGGDAAPPSTAAAVAQEVEAEALLKQRELEAKMQLQQEQLDEREVRLREGETRLRMREKELDRRIEGVLAQRLSEMEAEWAQRKERRERMEVQASTEFARIESKLRDTLTEAERRERTLRDLQTDAQRAVASKMEELSLERTRYKEESKLHVELEQQRSKDLVERIAQLRKRCATAEQRSASAEEKLTVLRVDMRSRPETVSDAHEKIVGLESSNMQMQLALEAAMAKTVSTTRAQAREGSLSRSRSRSLSRSSPHPPAPSFRSFVRSSPSPSHAAGGGKLQPALAAAAAAARTRGTAVAAHSAGAQDARRSAAAPRLCCAGAKVCFLLSFFLHFAVLFYSSPTRPAHSSPTTSPILAELCSTVIASASRS
tara:strand:+ start:68 stop:2425 length:2358 start_codon:yes stop_codon:yes gene_type:complete